MRVATQLDYPSIEASRLPTFLITISKLVLWLSMTLVILYFLFDDTSDQFSAMFYNQGGKFENQIAVLDSVGWRLNCTLAGAEIVLGKHAS